MDANAEPKVAVVTPAVSAPVATVASPAPACAPVLANSPATPLRELAFDTTLVVAEPTFSSPLANSVAF